MSIPFLGTLPGVTCVVLQPLRRALKCAPCLEDLNPGERHSRDTRDDGTVTLCALRAATVLSRDCRADFGRPLTKKVMSHSRDGPGVTAPLRTNIVPLTGVWNTPPSVPPLKKSLSLGDAPERFKTLVRQTK